MTTPSRVAPLSAVAILALAASLIAAPAMGRNSVAGAAAGLPPDAANVSLVTHLGGETRAAAAFGSVAYIGIGPRLAIVNIANPDQPTLRSQSAPLRGIVEGILVVPPYAYVVDGDDGLRIFDVTDINNPVEVGHADTPGYATDVALALHNSKPYAFVADSANGVVAYDVTDRANPAVVPAASYSGTQWTSGTTNGTAEALTAYTNGVTETRVFIAAGSAGLRVWDPFPKPPAVSGVERAVFITDTGELIDPYYKDVVMAVIAEESYRIYAADQAAGLRIIKVDEHPAWAAAQESLLPLSGSPSQVGVGADSTKLYVTTGLSGIDKVDVTLPAAPQYLGTVDTPGNAVDVGVAGNFAYVADTEFGLRVVDVSAMTARGAYAGVGSARDIAIRGDYAWVADGTAGLKSIGILTPSSASVAGSSSFTTGVQFDALAISGALAYVVDNALIGVRAISLTEPMTPALAGSYASPVWGAATDIAVDGNRAYVAASVSGLRVLDIAAPQAMAELGSYTAANLSEARAVAVSGTTAYVGDIDVADQTGLHALNVAVPGAITQLGATTLVTQVYDVAVWGNRAFVAAGDAGLRILNVANPAAISSVGGIDTPGSATGVRLASRFYALVSDYSRGLRVIDISNQAAPVEVGYYDTSGTSLATAYQRYAYTADWEGGVWILDALSTDLGISKSSGKTVALLNDVITYTIAISNAGGRHAEGVVITDTFPASLAGVTWTCAATSGSACPASGSGDLNATADILAGGRVTFTAAGTVTATGSPVVNTACLSAATDADPANNCATETLASALANLGIRMSRAQTAVVPGLPITYTLIVTRAGTPEQLAPQAVGLAVRVTNDVPTGVTGVQWQCAASPEAQCASASGSGNLISATVNMAAGGVATFTVAGVVDPGARGSLINTARVAPPPGYVDPNPADDESTDTATLSPEAGLSVSKTFAGNRVPGSPVTYTIMATNTGPSAVAVAVTDTFPPEIAGVAWTCLATGGSGCPASGVGNLTATSSTVSLLPGTRATIAAFGTLDAGTLSDQVDNSVTIAALGGVSNTNPGGDTASVSFLVRRQINVAVSGSASPNPVKSNQRLVYQVQVSNNGPAVAMNVLLTATLPASVTLQSVSAGCVAAGVEVRCAVGHVAGGATASVGVTVTAPTATSPLTVPMTIAATGSGEELDPSTNTTTIVALMNPHRMWMPMVLAYRYQYWLPVVVKEPD